MRLFWKGIKKLAHVNIFPMFENKIQSKFDLLFLARKQWNWTRALAFLGKNYFYIETDHSYILVVYCTKMWYVSGFCVQLFSKKNALMTAIGFLSFHCRTLILREEEFCYQQNYHLKSTRAIWLYKNKLEFCNWLQWVLDLIGPAGLPGLKVLQ